MVVGILRVEIEVPSSLSLKDKRAVVRSLKSRIEARFTVAVAEVGELNDRKLASLAVATVGNEAAHVDSVLAKIANYAETNPGDGNIRDIAIELVHLD